MRSLDLVQMVAFEEFREGDAGFLVKGNPTDAESSEKEKALVWTMDVDLKKIRRDATDDTEKPYLSRA